MVFVFKYTRFMNRFVKFYFLSSKLSNLTSQHWTFYDESKTEVDEEVFDFLFKNKTLVCWRFVHPKAQILMVSCLEHNIHPYSPSYSSKMFHSMWNKRYIWWIVLIQMISNHFVLMCPTPYGTEVSLINVMWSLCIPLVINKKSSSFNSVCNVLIFLVLLLLGWLKKFWGKNLEERG